MFADAAISKIAQDERHPLNYIFYGVSLVGVSYRRRRNFFCYRTDADSLIFMSICWFAGCGGSTGGRRGRRDVVDIDADDGAYVK